MSYAMEYAARCASGAALIILGLGTAMGARAARPLLNAQGQQSDQQSGQSVAEAARKAREQQKNAPKAKTVWTNDNIPNSPGELSVVGKAPAASAASSSENAPAAGNANASSNADKEKIAQERAKASSELDEAQQRLRSLKTDLSILQQEYNLDSAQLYSTPDYTKNQRGQAKVDAEKTAMAAKQDEVNAAQKKVDDLAKQMKSLGGKVEAAPAPAAPAPSPHALKP
ncbi:MAG: hypothetical protein ACYC92_02875 [Candidatus Acidiferrales bacterium]